MVQKLIILLFLAFGSVGLYAQGSGTVKGRVVDSTGTPVDFVTVVIEQDQRLSTTTDTNGAFSLTIPANREYTIVFSSVNTKPIRKSIKLTDGQVLTTKQIVTYKANYIKQVDITADKKGPIEAGAMDIKVVSQMSSVYDGIEAYLVGVTRNNELSSAYSVRGGNFDENLVYVNDFEVYRPFLIRSGQQEGLSFVNTNMVSNVRFSLGGFQAKYGDKMSSVLDVTYKRPNRFGGSIYGSLLGFGGNIEGCDKKQIFTFNIGVRQRTSQYILKSLDEKGQYSPNFIDVQGFFTAKLSQKWALEYLINYSRNQFIFKPVNRETTFGLLTDVKKFTVYFDGQEADQYQTLMNGLALVYTPKDNLYLKLLGSQYHSEEKEAYDILGEYYLSQVESDLGKDNFGDVLYSLGIGGLQRWARNTLRSDVYYAGHRGTWTKTKGILDNTLQWGVDYKREVIQDRISEWEITDSAGHSLPYAYGIDYNNVDSNGNVVPYTKLTIGTDRLLKSNFDLKSNRFSGFVQNTFKWGADSAHRFSIVLGARFQYWDVNKEFIVTPRLQFLYKPKGRNDITLTAAVGTYYQPPFYREMRNLEGQVNTNLKAQKSLHALVGVNYAFRAWKRNFSFNTEVYYKYLWDQVPYEFDNVLIRYYGTNSSIGHTGGIDLRLNGELAEGLESWISLGVMGAFEDIKGDKYTSYFDSSGTAVANVQVNQESIVDSSTIYPGFIPRPTDQRVTFSMFFQDYIPKFKFIKVHLTMVFGSGLPFGPPDNNRYKDQFRIPTYRRVDIGFSGQIWNPKWAKKANVFNQGLKSAWISLEVFNIFGITNTVSYLWVKDANNINYAIPNYLTARRINAKIMFNF